MVNISEIKARREALSLTMLEAATRSGMRTRMDWNKIESGRIADPRGSTLYAMAITLGCRIEDLLTRPTRIKPTKPSDK